MNDNNNIGDLNELLIIDYLNELHWNNYKIKKTILDYFTYLYNEFNKNILEIENKISNYNIITNFHEYIYIKENINNYSNEILNNIHNFKNIINDLENDILFYKIKNYVNHFTINNISTQIYNLQQIINDNNKIKNRLVRWNSKSYNDLNLFEINLNNILSQSNN
tara:strand:- start:707 stop:1201 length:495 start_codon:yes stop_codon:yes gene_type:complete